jgi:hypothetical protein
MARIGSFLEQDFRESALIVWVLCLELPNFVTCNRSRTAALLVLLAATAGTRVVSADLALGFSVFNDIGAGESRPGLPLWVARKVFGKNEYECVMQIPAGQGS